MAANPPLNPFTLTIPAAMMRRLEEHLLPGDGDEHGAVIAAGLAAGPRGTRLLARELFPARDGVDYVPGGRGYRALNADFVGDRIRFCRDNQLVYLAVHCHGGTGQVAFSHTDMASHQRGYPALLDISGQPVGALVLARGAVAGDIWLPDRSRTELAHTRVVGRSFRTLYPAGPPLPPSADTTYDRQTRLFGDRGQDLLARMKVGVIGAGGAGSLLVQQLAHLGVGHLVVLDPERIEVTNLSRVVGSTRRDARARLTGPGRPQWLRRYGLRTATPKVDIARRLARQSAPGMNVEAVFGNATDAAAAARLTDCDFLFLAADSAQARLVFNSLVHQFLIPGIQVGAKVRATGGGELLEVFAVCRPVTPDAGCLWCNGLINTARLAQEAVTPAERAAQRYVQDSAVTAPSVITLNSVATAHAANDFLFTVTGLHSPDVGGDYLRWLPREGVLRRDAPRRDPACPECGTSAGSRLARGDGRRLPTNG